MEINKSLHIIRIIKLQSIATKLSCTEKSLRMMAGHILVDAYRKLKLKASHLTGSISDHNRINIRSSSKVPNHLDQCQYGAICSGFQCEGCGEEKFEQGDTPAVDSNGIKTNLSIHWKPEYCPYLYNDHNYTIIPDIPKRFKDMKTEILMNSLFFACFCEKWYNGTRRLILRAADLVPRIGRCFQDWDVPNLIVFLRSNNDVVSLNLAYNNMHCAGFINLIDYVIAYKHILELNVQNNNIREPGINHLCQEGERIPLKTLRLNGNKFGVESAKKVALLLLKNQHLRCLDVAEVDQTASSLVYFSTVMRWDQQESNQTLKILDLSRPNPGCMYIFDSTHFASVIGCMLRFNRCLVELHLQKYNFSCHDIEIMLEDLKYNETLHLLDLSNNNIGDHGIEQIANWLKTRPSLSGLLLAHNIVTSYGARALSFELPSSKIRMLDISHNRITDTGATDVLNSIKKSTILRYLRIFGNQLGHCTAKIVDRMLVSGVLVQENVDVKPYRVEHKWYMAQYPSDHYKQRYYNVPRYAFPQPLKIPYIPNMWVGKAPPKVYFKYVDPVPIEDRRQKMHQNHQFDCTCCQCKDDDVMNSLAPSTTDIISEACICGVCTYEVDRKKPSTFQSDITLLPEPSCGCHPYDCACCYCLPCKGKNEDLSSEEKETHSVNCNCCKCGNQVEEYASSSISTKSNELHDYPDRVDALKKIALILERVDDEMQQQILRWINVDEVILNEDLAMLDPKIAEMDERRQRGASLCDKCNSDSGSLQDLLPEPECSSNCEEFYSNVQQRCDEFAPYDSIDADSFVTNVSCKGFDNQNQN